MAQETMTNNSVELIDSEREDSAIRLVNGTAVKQETRDLRLSNFEFDIGGSMVSITDLKLEDAVMKIREIEQANVHLRDYLKKNNEEVKRLYESLRTLKMKDKEKFDQAKAVITALRKENEELQGKVLNLDETVTNLQESLKSADQENTRLRQLNVNQELLPAIKDHEDEPDAMFVSGNNQEAVIAELKRGLTTKDEYIDRLQADLTKHQESARQLLIDLESQQKLKVATDEENRRLNQQLVEDKKKFHEELHIHLNSTKRELEAHPVMKSIDGLQKVSPTERSSISRLQHESIDDLLERAQSMEEAKSNGAEKIKALRDKEMIERQELEKKMQELTEKVKELNLQNGNARQIIATIEKKKSEEMYQLSQEYEAKLTEKTKQEIHQPQKPANTDDTAVMKSQVLSLFKEVNEAQAKYSDALAIIHHKDDKIAVLYKSLGDLEKHHIAASHENQMLFQHLDRVKTEQIQAQQAYSALKEDNNTLTLSFNKLVTDYKAVVNLLDMFKERMAELEREKEQKRLSSENMEQLSRLTAEVLAAEEALNLKDEQLAELKTKRNKLEEDTEIFRIQAETYRSDFAYERESRTKLAQERDELSEALKRSQEDSQIMKEQLREFSQRQLLELRQRVMRPSQETTPRTMEDQGAVVGMRPGEIGYNALRPGEIGPNTLCSGEIGPNKLYPGEIGPNTSRHGLSQASQQPLFSHSRTLPMGHHHGSYRQQPQATSSFYRGVPTNSSFIYNRGGHPIQAQQDPQLAGDGEFASLVQYECPSCGAQFPDMDTLNLHLPDCMDEKQRE